MEPEDAAARLHALSAEIAATYGVRGSFQRQVRKLGAALPRYERQQAAALVRVERMLARGTPAEAIDGPRFEHAELTLQMHLEQVEAADVRKSFALDITTTVLVNAVLACLVLAGLAAWLLS
ncbi:MAG: hypothetical protein AAF576_00515 [Pseudomonadota bacterium]